jgi:hypothetical protein
MNRLIGWGLAGVLTLACGPLYGQAEAVDLRATAQGAVTGCSRGAFSRIERLRQAGPEGLAALVAVCDELSAAPPEDAQQAAILRRRMTQAIDAVSGQRDGWTSRLYWHTDLDSALAEAARTGKPILSLRLLGNLTDECSCANSRFFRTALYANAEVSAALRERFVLHWKSVRPVPRITIDFGDGRRIERTITGNSIHYVLDAHGRLVDALPGLYGPGAFLRCLQRAEVVATGTGDLGDVERQAVLARFHASRAADIARDWSADLSRAGVSAPTEEGAADGAAASGSSAPAEGAPPAAHVAGDRARTKHRVELPLLAAMGAADPAELEQATSDDAWQRIAGLHAADAALDQGSVALMAAKEPPPAAAAAEAAYSKTRVEDPLLKLVASFERSIALDTVRNEYLLHRRIHEWLAAGDVVTTPAVDDFNERVYAELFLTPSSDPWLGLVPPDAYTALENGGLVQAP